MSPPSQPISKSLKKARGQRFVDPLWKGPELDGVTQSMLNDFLFCRERFRIKYVLGLAPPDEFNYRREYGSMWHICEECAANGGLWETGLLGYAKGLTVQYREQQEQVVKWYRVCQEQFSVYLTYWKKGRGSKRTVSSESVFDVCYRLPSGLTVRLRGKRDEVFRRAKSYWLQENKTKSEIDEVALRQQLSFDLQTMFYLVATEIELGKAITGVRYNVVLRPLSGGKGTIRPLQNVNRGTKLPAREENADEFYARLRAVIAEDPACFFARWESRVSSADKMAYRVEFLDPVLQDLCDWYDAVKNCGKEFPPVSRHWRTPYGIWNPLARGTVTEVDEYLRTGSSTGLERKDRLFKELDY